MSTDTPHQRDPVAEFIRKWTDVHWWSYLLADCDGFLNFWCRAQGHADVWWFSHGDEPDMRCQRCGEDLG